MRGYVVEPGFIEMTPARLSGLEVPEGFTVSVFARDLGNPRILTAGPEGRLYASRRETGDVILLRNANGDGEADGPPQVIANRPMLHGLHLAGDTMYLTTVADLFRAPVEGDGTLGPLERIVTDLPAGGQHPNRTLALGPDGWLYVSVGSTRNACDETTPESATLLRVRPDGSQREIFASGLRNTIGFGWHPATGVLYGWDHGIDWLGTDVHPEEFNRIEAGATYGWPYIYADGQENPQDKPPGGMTMAEWRQMSTEPTLTHTPHAAPMQMRSTPAASSRRHIRALCS